MIIKCKDLKSACSKILTAIDNNSTSSYTGMVEFNTINNVLYMNVTNKEYYVRVKLGNTFDNFHATISANLFLKLISQITTEDIALTTDERILTVSGNGKYKFPLIYNDKDILSLPEINIINKTLEMNIPGVILNSILINNSKELSKIPKSTKLDINPLQRMYYIDNEGAITFYNGAVVNKFTLDKPIKLLFNSNLVRLFSLFKNENIEFSLGYDAVSDELTQTKVKFKAEDIEITSILNCDDNLIKLMPAEAIRKTAFNEYEYTAVVNRNDLLAAIQRITLFSGSLDIEDHKTAGKIKFTKNMITLSDRFGENSETLDLVTEIDNNIDTYSMYVDYVDLKLALESREDKIVSIGFGNHSALVVAKDNIYSVIPEMLE